MAFDAIVRLYRRDHQAALETQIQSFAAESTLESAVIRAALARTPAGKRYAHQRRIKRSVLEESQRRLLELDFTLRSTFAEIHTDVDVAIGSVSGAGELLVYDTALRIGAKLALLPDRVYMHCGTRAGVRALGLDWKRESIAVEELPGDLGRLRPYEAEDCLCIFKKRFE